MPAKLQSTFLIGQPGDGSTGSVSLANPLIEFGLELPQVGASQALPQSSTAEIIEKTPRTALPLSVTLTPPVPVVSKSTGPSLQVRQLWEGTVTEIRDNGFVAKLNDRTEPKNPEEWAVFENIEISEDDQSLIKPGSVFYWMIGTERSPAGIVKNVSAVEFRRLPSWSRSSVNDASARANHLKQWFHSEP